jgi:hypothetical protein
VIRTRAMSQNERILTTTPAACRRRGGRPGNANERRPEMGTIVVSDNVSLDGVIQDPAGDEGFRSNRSHVNGLKPNDDSSPGLG